MPRRPFFTVLSFCQPCVPEVQFSSLVKGELFSNRDRNLFHRRNFENRPLKPGNFLSWRFRSEIQLSIKLSYFVTDLHEVFDYCFSICTHFNWSLICKSNFFLKTRTREHYFVNIIWGNFGWKLNSSLFSLDILSLDLVQLIKLLSIFIYFTVFRLSYWLLISNSVHNASRQ